jgi:predicted phosphate transport protein (TIGR00153 family)
MGLREWLIPQDKVFFDLLEEESKVVVLGAHQLEDAVENFDRLEERRRELKETEHRADEIVHHIYDKVNRTFITPIDQQDIVELASLYDDVLDFVYATMNRMVLYEVKGSTGPMRELAKLVTRSVDEIHQAFLSMRKIDEKEIEERCREVDRLENEADALLNDSVAALFKGNDAIYILKMKEVYEHLEATTDKCEDVSFKLRDIVLKHT